MQNFRTIGFRLPVNL